MPLDSRHLSGLAGTFFGDLDEAVRQALLDDASLIEVPRGQSIFAEEPAEPSLGFILDGNARTFIDGPGGRQLTVRYVRPGSIVATATPGSAGTSMQIRIEAVTPCTVIELNVETVRRMLRTEPQFS